MRTRLLGAGILVAALTGFSPRAAFSVNYTDGATHTISDSTTGEYGVDIRDSLSGETTTVNIVDPAEIGLAISDFLVPPDPMHPFPFHESFRMITLHGGQAILNFFGGTSAGEISALSCEINLYGGTIGNALGFSITSLRAGSSEVHMSGGRLEAAAYTQDSCVTVTGGIIGSDGLVGNSVQALRSRFDFSDAAAAGSIDAAEQSFLILNDATVGADNTGVSIYARQSVAEITAGSFGGGLVASDGSRVTIDGKVSFGEPFVGHSIEAHGNATKFTRIEVNDGDFDGSILAGDASIVRVRGGEFGADSGHRSIVSGASTGFATVKVDDGDFTGGVRANDKSRLTINGGSFGFALGFVSLRVEGEVGADSHATVNDGTFESELQASGETRVRVNGGAFGSNIATGVSVGAGAQQGTAIVDVFGGSYAGGFKAGTNGIIRVFGTGLQINSGMLTGTLADGTPISVDASTQDNGQIQLHDPTTVTMVEQGEALIHSAPGSLLKLALLSLFQTPQPACDGNEGTATDIAFETLPIDLSDLMPGPIRANDGADLVIRRLADARNPGRPGNFRDTVPIELLALQLQSIEAVDLSLFGGRGSERLFITLQSDRSAEEIAEHGIGLLSAGDLDIDFAMQTYEASFDVYFDVRAGSLDGDILLSLHDLLTTPYAVPWSLELMNGGELTEDFYSGIIGGAVSQFSFEGDYLLYTAQQTVLIPEPSATALGMLAAAWLAADYRRRRASKRALVARNAAVPGSGI